MNAGWGDASAGGRDDPGWTTSVRCRLSIIGRSLSLWIRFSRPRLWSDSGSAHRLFEGFYVARRYSRKGGDSYTLDFEVGFEPSKAAS